MRVTVSNTKILSVLLDEKGTEYAVVDDRTVDIFAQMSITELTLALKERDCDLLSANERDESLEAYFMNLVGVQSHE